MTKKNTSFLEFSNLCEKLQATSKKLQKRSILAKFLPLLSDEQLQVVALFILGKIFPDYDSRSINVSWRTVQKIFEKIKPARLNSNSLSILDVKNVFVEIAQTTGKGSRKKNFNWTCCGAVDLAYLRNFF